MIKLVQVVAVTDYDSHWYVIPKELTQDFFRLLDAGETYENEFIEKYSEYMTGGDLNLKQLYAEF